jgi:hypothetical protein
MSRVRDSKAGRERWLVLGVTFAGNTLVISRTSTRPLAIRIRFGRPWYAGILVAVDFSGAKSCPPALFDRVKEGRPNFSCCESLDGEPNCPAGDNSASAALAAADVAKARALCAPGVRAALVRVRIECDKSPSL